VSGLVDAVKAAIRDGSDTWVDFTPEARRAVEAVIKGIEDEFTGDAFGYPHEALEWLRNELEPPKETPVMVLEGVWEKYTGYKVDDVIHGRLFADMVDALKEHGMLKEGT